MDRIHLFFIKALIITSLISCQNEREFSEVKNLSEYANTEFIPTLEHQISKENNAVYCATMLFSWNEIRKIIRSEISVPNEYPDLKLLNDSKSYIGVLNRDEYKASGEVDGNMIKARAEFKKSLPFEIKLNSYKGKLTFDGRKVASFGVAGFDDDEILRLTKIVYYKDDNNFIVKLLPKDKTHEIVLFKTEQSFHSMAEMVNEISKLTETGNREREDKNFYWKYRWNYEDELRIPKFNFNIETNYSTLEGSQFSADKQIFNIEKAWQRTAFILDESGAEIESEASIAVAADAAEEEVEEPKPKKMIFDKEFLILLKRKDSEQPYFGLWSTNTELMIKE